MLPALYNALQKVGGCGATSGSGWVGVVPFERGERGGSNGGGLTVAVAVLAELWQLENGSEKNIFFLDFDFWI
jgi:hypothetical protein